MDKFTLNLVAAGDCKNISPEFGRTEDVRRVFGIKRGTLYNLFQERRIKGVLLRQRGSKTGVRLWDMASIREYILSQFSENHTDNDDDLMAA